MNIKKPKAAIARHGFRRREKSCGAIIVSDSGRILLIHQRKGHWSFPKGHVESGETEEMTALREVKEEVGLDVRLTPDFGWWLPFPPVPASLKMSSIFWDGR